jgi:hypothetical protein
VASRIFSLIDTNHDGRISEDEGRAYAEQLRHSIELLIDGVPVSPKLIPGQFPELAEMNEGTGMIRLQGSADFPAVAAGRHALYYRNRHEPSISVYLSNALVSSDKQVEITAQHRDNAQDELIIDYRLAGDSHWPSLWWLLVAAPLAAVGVHNGMSAKRGARRRKQNQELLAIRGNVELPAPRTLDESGDR